MVTHDRYFLDRVTNKILELSMEKFIPYEAKYSTVSGNESRERRNGAGIREKTSEHSQNGAGMGKTGAAVQEPPSREQGLTVWRR